MLNVELGRQEEVGSGRWEFWMLDVGCWMKDEDGRWKMEDGRWKMEDGRWGNEKRALLVGGARLL
jgi:hypothetical protein